MKPIDRKVSSAVLEYFSNIQGVPVKKKFSIVILKSRKGLKQRLLIAFYSVNVFLVIVNKIFFVRYKLTVWTYKEQQNKQV